jgi:hypothetical protein
MVRKIDFYKSVLLIIAALFVYLYFESIKVGRFSFVYNSELEKTVILDTKSGATYSVEDESRRVGILRLNSEPIIK